MASTVQGRTRPGCPPTPVALAGTVCVGTSLQYRGSRTLVIDHRLCHHTWISFLTSHLLLVTQYLIKNSLEREIMLARKVRSGYYLSAHEVAITIIFNIVPNSRGRPNRGIPSTWEKNISRVKLEESVTIADNCLENYVCRKHGTMAARTPLVCPFRIQDWSMATALRYSFPLPARLDQRAPEAPTKMNPLSLLNVTPSQRPTSMLCYQPQLPEPKYLPSWSKC